MSEKPKATIFAITNIKNDFWYIGSSYNYKAYKRALIGFLKRNKFKNPPLQKLYNEFGKEIISFRILEECKQDKILERKQYYIENTKNIYNINDAIEKPRVLKGLKGTKWSDERKKKFSMRLKAYYSDYSKRPFGEKNGRYGKKCTTTHKEALSKTHKGKKIPYEVIQKRIETRNKNKNKK